MLVSRLASASARRMASSPIVPQSGRRFASTGPAPVGRKSWKGTFARWGVAGGALYLYTSSDAFRNYTHEGVVPGKAAHVPPKPQVGPSDGFMTAREIAQERHRKAAEAQARMKKEEEEAKIREAADKVPAEGQEGENENDGSFGAGLEQEASQQGAFNEETGEINWDCPCLGGMAQGPCGEEFKAAFSCFVFSKEEQKGIECVDKFRDMQSCFRQHPDVYGDELEQVDGDESGPENGGESKGVEVETVKPEDGDKPTTPEGSDDRPSKETSEPGSASEASSSSSSSSS